MFYAYSNNGLKIRPTISGQRAFCGCCNGPVIGKCGEIISWHWAHLSGSDCDSWAEPLTEWHALWQNLLEVEEGAEVEVPIKKNGQAHRADVILKSGTIVELQHSTISPEEIRERELYYGVHMIWIFDIRDAHDSGRFQLRNKRNEKHTFRWKHPKKSISFANRRVYLDLGNGWLFHLIKMYPDAPCGGIGELINRIDLTFNL